jgi:hypothetical protein
VAGPYKNGNDFRFNKKIGISWSAEKIFTSEEELSRLELVI